MVEKSTVFKDTYVSEHNKFGVAVERDHRLKPLRNPHQIMQALDKLERAYQCACDYDVDLWEFAIELADLKDCGVTRTSLRHLVTLGWVEHRREVTLPKLDCRMFQDEAKYSISERSCFVITPLGRRQIGAFVDPQETSYREPAESIPGLTPQWDSKRRELRLGTKLVKKFKWPASMQFAVLQRFEELGWPDRIDDPLPTASNICPKRRLHDAIKCLNQRTENDLIRFRGDGTGTGVLVTFESSARRAA